MMRVLTCKQCGGQMRKRLVKTRGNVMGILLALIVFGVGVTITVLIPIIGWGLGPLVCLFALFMGGKSKKVWRCRQCGSIIDRA